jgi:hypothetical protein
MAKVLEERGFGGLLRKNKKRGRTSKRRKVQE